MARNQPKIEEIIKKAVEAGRMSAERMPHDAYKVTEKRLYALPILRRKIIDDRERLQELKKYGSRENSKSIVRFQRSGTRLTPEEIREMLILDIEAAVAADMCEIEAVERALKDIKDDPYYFTVTGRYEKDLTDEQVAEHIPCDTTTVWRNRKRLVQRIAVRLYGVEAVK